MPLQSSQHLSQKRSTSRKSSSSIAVAAVASPYERHASDISSDLDLSEAECLLIESPLQTQVLCDRAIDCRTRDSQLCNTSRSLDVHRLHEQPRVCSGPLITMSPSSPPSPTDQVINFPTSPAPKKPSLRDYFNHDRKDKMPTQNRHAYRDVSPISSPTTAPENLEACLATPTKPPRRIRGYFICGSIWGLTILSIVFLIDLALLLSRNAIEFEADPDQIFANWGKSGTGTEGVAWYPTDFLRDVVPIQCHSHNDYWRKVPVFSALNAGCTGIEADVWLFDNDSKLYVGHDTAALTTNRTFESLYINPLVDLLNRSNPQTQFYNETRRGVFDFNPEQTVTLLVDVKTSGAKTWDAVVAQLEPLRQRGWLTYVENGVVHKGPVTVVGTGNTRLEFVTQNSTYRDYFFDAPLDKMWEDPDAKDAPASDEVLTYNSTNSFYASTSFDAAVGTIWSGLSQAQMKIIRGQVKGAHRRGLKVRYWDLPAWPIGRRNMVWKAVMEAGVDMLNVDDLRSASRRPW